MISCSKILLRKRVLILKTIVGVIIGVCMLTYLINNSEYNDNNLNNFYGLNIRGAPGEMGRPVILPKYFSRQTGLAIEDGWRKNAFNQFVSDLISVKRTLPDPRDEWCRHQILYFENLPQASVVICFHNEAWSMLLRTVHSVLDRSPEHLIKEILLVDDYSDMEHLKQQLNEYMSSYPKVKIVRTSRREGLIRARLIGAKHAAGPVLIFLDSHCECSHGWIEPLLDRIARNKTTVVCPTIDIIDSETLEYQLTKANQIIGGFNWNLLFIWIIIPNRESARRQHESEPLRSPTMAGGLFAIDKAFFEKLGTYDNEYDEWGAENLELSFKTWMCGGTLEIIPCSHVGHMFRNRVPYRIKNMYVKNNTRFKNNVRLAEVWLDDYAKYYYQRINFQKGEYGDVSSRKALREKLRCKSFDWYLKNVYPELYIPDEAVAQGEIENSASGLCLDLLSTPHHYNKPVELKPCTGYYNFGTQLWMYSKNMEIRRDEACLGYAGEDVFLYPCLGDNKTQLWFYDANTKLIHHVYTKTCMSVIFYRIVMEPCQKNESRQVWTIENLNSSEFKSTNFNLSFNRAKAMAFDPVNN